jgi:hypothetical protein
MRAETIDQVPLSNCKPTLPLCQILELCDEFVPGDPPEYFFDRNPMNFPTILNTYRTSQFHMKEGSCVLVLQRDLEYWNIGSLAPPSQLPCLTQTRCRWSLAVLSSTTRP